MGYNANSAGVPSAWARARNLPRTQITTNIQPGLFGCDKNVKNNTPAVEDSLDDHHLLDFLGDELHCSSLGGNEIDDGFDELLLDFPFPSDDGNVPVANESNLSLADQRNMQDGIKTVGGWLLSTYLEPEDFLESEDPSFSGKSTIPSLSRQSSISSQNSLVQHGSNTVASDGSMMESEDFSFNGVLPSLSRQCSTFSQNGLINLPGEMNSTEAFLRLPPTEMPPTHLLEEKAAPFVEDVLPPTEATDVQGIWSLLPNPREMKKDWCGQYIALGATECPVTPIFIPQASREFFMEGVPSLSRRRKIERYLEKRRRRIERLKMKKKESSKMYPARSNVASKRVRVGGRFVCSSEWGKRIRPAH
jgi:hypothetical protein